MHNNKIFENATVPSCIPFIQNGKNTFSEQFVRITEFANKNFKKKYDINIQRYYDTNQHMFRTEDIERISVVLEKIKKFGTDLNENFYVSTGAEIHGKEKKDKDGRKISGRSKFDVLHPHKDEGFKPYIEGSAIKKSQDGRYSTPKIDTWLDYSEPEKMRSPKFKELFESEKIIIRRSSGLLGILAIYDDNGIYTSEKCILIIKKSKLPISHSQYKNKLNMDLKYVLGILNSKLMNFYYQSVYGGFIDVYPNNLKQLPIVESSKELSDKLISLVNDVINKKQNNEDAGKVEREIDFLVYKIYDLTDEEIDIIEGE